ncbi:MAG: dihydroorotase [Desulfobacteraceae bacterium]|nr:MAG: dihydroorotase [Desulfobacteraceae bacterium]
MPIWIKYGKIVDPIHNQIHDFDLIIESNKIIGMMPWNAFSENSRDFTIINAKNKLIIPGLIDMHVHLREPGFEYKETIQTGAQAGVAGGFVGLACMPNTEPVNDRREITRFILEQASKAGLLKVYPIAAITEKQQGKKLCHFDELREAGAMAVSDDGFPVADSDLMRQALELAKANNLMVISHCEDRALSQGGVMHDGPIARKLGLKGISSLSEEKIVQREVDLAQSARCPVHIAHVSTSGSVEIIRRAKAAGVLVTAETAPHYFTLNHEALLHCDTNLKMNPPLRTPEDVAAIQEGLRDGTLDIIATDHAPHSLSDKNRPFEKASFGIIGLETALPLTLALVRKNILSLPAAIKKMSYNPAQILGLSGGFLCKGGAADLAIIDPNFEYVLNTEAIHSKSKNTPFLGQKLQGRNCLTMVQGKIVWNCLTDQSCTE